MLERDHSHEEGGHRVDVGDGLGLWDLVEPVDAPPPADVDGRAQPVPRSVTRQDQDVILEIRQPIVCGSGMSGVVIDEEDLVERDPHLQ